MLTVKILGQEKMHSKFPQNFIDSFLYFSIFNDMKFLNVNNVLIDKKYRYVGDKYDSKCVAKHFNKFKDPPQSKSGSFI